MKPNLELSWILLALFLISAGVGLMSVSVWITVVCVVLGIACVLRVLPVFGE